MHVEVARPFMLAMALATLLSGCGSSQVEVPDLESQRLTEAAQAIIRSDLVIGDVAREDGSQGQFDCERVVDQEPEPGSLVAPGTVVNLVVEPPEDEVVVPDLVGRFHSDAQSLGRAQGIVVLNPADIRGAVRLGPLRVVAGRESEIVLSQDIEAGTVVSFGTTVRVEARFPHVLEQDGSREVFDVHGLLYLRYGFQGTASCNPCHTPSTCISSECHSGPAISRLASATPDDLPTLAESGATE